MRKMFLLLMFLFTITLYTFSQDVIVDNPPFRSSNQTFTEVEKVTISDTETAIKMVGYNNPGWWIKIADVTYIEAEGKQYTIKRAEGIELNAEAPTNDKGEIHFTLYFDAIPKETKEITFNEDGSIINGIQLSSSTLQRTTVPQEFLDATKIVDDGKPLPTPQLIDGKATLKGKVAGYLPEMKMKFEFFVNNPITGNQEEYICMINDDGSFEYKIPLVSTMSVLFRFGRDINKYVVLSPNEETRIYIDLEQKSCKEARLRNDKCENGRYVYFAGANAELNNQLFDKAYEEYYDKFDNTFYNRLMNDVVGMDAIQYRDYLYTEEKNRLTNIDQLGVTQKMKEYLSICQKYDTFYWLYMGSYYLEAAYEKAHGGSKDGFKESIFDNEYYTFIKDLPFNEFKSFYSPNYGAAVGYMTGLDNSSPVYLHSITKEMLENIPKQPFYDSKYDDVVEYIKKDLFEAQDPTQLAATLQRYKVVIEALKKANRLEGNALVLADKILMADKINSEKELGRLKNLILNVQYKIEEIRKDSAFFAQVGVEHFDSIHFPRYEQETDSLFRNKVYEFYTNDDVRNYFNKFNNLLYIETKTNEFREITGIESGLCYELLLLKSVASGFEEMNPLSQSDLDFYATYIKNPFFTKYLTRKNNELIAQIEKSKKNPYNVHQAPQVAEDQLLHEILKPHEGKVIFIDFWNTWCGPCRQAMKEFAETKESYKDKDVVFVYLADHSSPEAGWKNMIATIGGEHFRLTYEQMDYLKTKFGVKGIPSYLIFNKKGEQVYFRIGFEGAQKISEILDKHLAVNNT